MSKFNHLQGQSRRNFLRWTTAVGAALALDRAKVLDVICDTAGSALADDACGATLRSVHLVAGNGGLAWFQLLWPHVDIAKSNDPNFAFHAQGKAKPATDTDKPFYFAPESPWQSLDKTKRITALMSGQNETHTNTPRSSAQIGGNQSMVAVIAAIQRATPSLLPVIGINPLDFGTAPGAPSIATVNNADGIVQLFNSAASRATLQAAEDAAAFEAYYKAFTGLNKAASRPTWARALRIGKSSANLLGRNLAALLSPTDDDMTRYGLNAGTPDKIKDLGRALMVAARAFKQGLTQSVIVPALRDDPHGAFGDMNNLTSTVGAIGKILDEFMKDLAAVQDPTCMGRTMADTTVLTVHGDTPKDPRNRNGWPDGTPNNSNWIYVLSNGYLKTGWFGGVKADGSVAGFDPKTGNEVPNQQSNVTSDASSAAVAYAVSKGDIRRVADFYRGPGLDGIINKSLI